jgi:hypothetical protein
VYTDLDTTGATSSGATALESGGNNIQLCEADVGTVSPTVDDFVLWNSSTHPVFTDATWGALGVTQDNTSAWLNDTMAARLARWLDVANVTGAASEVSDSMAATLNPVDTVSTLADALKVVSADTMGATWITKEGAIRIRDAAALTDETNYSSQYITQWAALNDEKATALTLNPVRVSKRSRTGARVDRVINDVQITGNDGPDVPLLTRVLDRASQLLYGRRVFTQAVDVKRSVFTAKMPAIAQDIIDRFKAPPLEVGELVIEPWGSNEHSQFVIKDLELERCVRYTETVPGTANVILDGRLRIQSEAWDWSDGDK